MAHLGGAEREERKYATDSFMQERDKRVLLLVASAEGLPLSTSKACLWLSVHMPHLERERAGGEERKR